MKAKSEGRDYSKLTAIEYMSQLVNGQNYFVKVIIFLMKFGQFVLKSQKIWFLQKKIKAKSAAGQIVHLRIFQPFPHHGSTDPQLHGILHDKKHEEPIHYF